MRHLLRCIAILSLALGLAACGPTRKSVFPPTVSIQQLTVRADGQWHLALRIQNNSYGGMDFSLLDGELKLADGLPVRVASRFDRDIPAFAADTVELNILPTPAMNRALAAIAGKGSAAGLPYQLNGRISAQPEQEKQPRDFEFHGQNWLSPVPGIANTYR